jgi:hypothetical protein
LKTARCRLAIWVALLPCLGCAFGSPHLPEPPSGSVGVAGEYAIEFLDRIETFYNRLIQRRFNTLETFNDVVLRDHFQSQDAFFDYYAELAQTLHDANFERTRSFEVEVEEFVFESRFLARVQVRFRGKDRRPLRPGTTVLIRQDLWERVDERWWIQPAKL